MRHRVNLLDMWIDKIDLAGAVAQVDAFARADKPHQVVTVNVDFLRIGTENPSFRDLINTADLVVPDGMPLLWGSRLLGDPLPQRVTGVELIDACAQLSALHGHRIFLLGAEDGVAEDAADVLRNRYPGSQIAGTYAPPVGSFSPSENEAIIRMIQEMQVQMLFVAFGAPKQDQWIRTNMHRLNVPMCMGVGGAFDMLAGRVRRAPTWAQEHGMEWLCRLAQEPRRLWKRYLIHDLPIFMQLMTQKRTGSPAGGAVTSLLEATAPLHVHEDALKALDVLATAEEQGVHVA